MAERPIDPRIEIGRVRLAVADIDRSLAFYRNVLGFEVARRTAAAVFLTAGGYHHHLILHVDGGHRSASPSGGLRFGVRYPDRRSLSGVFRRLTAAGVSVESALDLGNVEAIAVSDPDGHQVELYYERQHSDYPRAADGSVRTAPEPLDLESLHTVVPPERAGAAPTSSAAVPLSDQTRARLRDMRLRLLNLHKVLLDDARAAYEMDRGHVKSNANLLQLVISDPWFAWLHPLSELVVRIDEVLRPDAPTTEGDSAVLLDQVARLLSPGGDKGPFAEHYFEALQRQPAVIVAHAEVRRILKEAR